LSFEKLVVIRTTASGIPLDAEDIFKTENTEDAKVSRFCIASLALVYIARDNFHRNSTEFHYSTI
jgi:peptide methionine sulfoxide reductase MsrB